MSQQAVQHADISSKISGAFHDFKINFYVNVMQYLLVCMP